MDERRALVAELVTELSPGHVMYGHHFTAVYQCSGCDLAIFCVESDRPAWFAVVQMLHSGRPEPPPWPLFGRLPLPFTDVVMKHGHSGSQPHV